MKQGFPPLDRQQRERLDRFEHLLRDVAIPRGMVAEGDRDTLSERHVLDSLRAATVFSPTDRLSVDFGSGAGLPGIVLAVALPACRFVLAESRGRRAGFLELAIEELGLSNSEVFHGRVEDLAVTADIATARAFSQLPEAWEAAYPRLRPGGRLVYFAGEGLGDPVTAAQRIPPERRPAAIRSDRVLENATPLVIMSRG